MRMSAETMVERAQVAEAAGFGGISLMDHLAPPFALDQPMLEAMSTATWLASRTEMLRVGHLVLCDAFRHPAVLARQAVSLDHMSNGRFDLGIGWGSVPDEFDTFGVGETTPAVRVRRMAETLEVLKLLWSGEEVDFDGEFHTLVAARQRPVPLTTIPIIIGGVGDKTLDLVARYADWWNIPVNRLDKLEEKRSRLGNARVSVQQFVAVLRPGDDRQDVTDSVTRRFGSLGRPVVGTPEELVDQFGALAERGVDRIYVWFTDFAAPETLRLFGEWVIAHFRHS
jgi:alkanesulfonate monooxygenase SsuD/methylene tetrahydromethanopterin reductase-like flavin-dependent oxidoreductase (luciferase family)